MWKPILGALLAAACAPRYGGLEPMAPEQLWSPLPVRHVDVGGVDVAYIDSGGDKPPLVLVHGLSSYHSYWEYQIAYYAQRYRVIALDLPGYGQSGRPDAPYTPPWYADVVAGWMDAVGVPRAPIMAHSMGAQVAMTLALSQPERVEALILSGPAGFERFTPGEAKTIKTFWTESRALQSNETELRATFTAVVFNRPDPGVERLLQERVRMTSTAAFRGTSVAVARSIAGMVDHPVADRLGELRAPTLIVYGTDDRMIPNPLLHGGRTATIANAAVKAIPGAELALLPGAGHTGHHDDPEGFHRAVDAFLARLPARPATVPAAPDVSPWGSP
jgi:pimeloyl-ACP methyl ester carboxylesterase